MKHLMDCRLNVYAIPGEVSPAELAGGMIVVIDVLRASTTIIHALEAGAIEVVPCLEVADAQGLAASTPHGQYVLGGERGGLPIPGFDLGNSPGEYTPASVGGKTLIFTTTNGTRAMMTCREAAHVVIGAFVNASAVVDRLAGQPQVYLLCAGSGGEVTRDDVLFAGLVVERLFRGHDTGYRLNAQAVTARESWISAFPAPRAVGGGVPQPELLAAELRKGLAGQKLMVIGMADDILTAAQIDRFRSVPEMDPKTLRIRLP
jgi:2-phosphosulfolactate phosphatase